MPAFLGAQINFVDIAAQSVPGTSFRAVSADVQNWRVEAATYLKLRTQTALLIAFGAGSETVPRCVRLNNYWCIKGKGWTGQLGSDGSGHAAFEAAPAGARAAAVLLRHYYVDLRRHSAIDITSHWAPNRCGYMANAQASLPRLPAPRARPTVILDIAKMGQKERMATFDRIIAARRKAADERYRQWLQFVKAANSGLLPRVPPVGAAVAQSSSQAARPARAAATPIFCGFEERRVAAYARRAIRGIAQTDTEDLQLFDADGRFTWRAARLMVNMAAVEIGPRSVDEDLVYRALHELDAAMVPLSKKQGS